MAISLADFHAMDPTLFEATGALDPILGIDTHLFIDPKLVRKTTVPELKGSYQRVQEYFADVLRIVKGIGTAGDVMWKKADRLLTFPEMKGLCIGYSSAGVSGRGMGEKKRARLLESTTLIVRNGIADPAIFELVGAFEEGVGPDLISDMIAKIIMEDLVTFTQRVCSDCGISMKPQYIVRGGEAEDLPMNPYTAEPIVLVPREILRDLPMAATYGDISWISEHNEKLRDELNKILGDRWRELTVAEKKQGLREAFIRQPDALAQIIEAYRSAAPDYYDFKDDPSGETKWYRASRDISKQFELKLSLDKKPTSDEIFGVAQAICDRFRTLLEDNQLCVLLYDKYGHRKHESAAQLLFFGIASAYCEANDLDLSPESDGGRGPVDFKVSSGFNGRVLVEVKLTSNQQLSHGFEKQLPIYQRSEANARGIYLVIDNVGQPAMARLARLKRMVVDAGALAPTVMYIDGVPRPSASKADK